MIDISATPDTTEYPFPEGNVSWNHRDAIALFCQPGYMSPDDWRPITFSAAMYGESGLNPLIYRKKVQWSPGLSNHLSMDLGFFQMNTADHVDRPAFSGWDCLTVSQCFDPFAVWPHVWNMLNIGREMINGEMTPWTYNMHWWHAFTGKSGDTYVDPPYKRHLNAALKGMREYREIMGLGPGIFNKQKVSDEQAATPIYL